MTSPALVPGSDYIYLALAVDPRADVLYFNQHYA